QELPHQGAAGAPPYDRLLQYVESRQLRQSQRDRRRKSRRLRQDHLHRRHAASHPVLPAIRLLTAIDKWPCQLRARATAPFVFSPSVVLETQQLPVRPNRTLV